MTEKKEKLIRGHRKDSALFTLCELQDLRAHQRTFEGAYWRTALAAFSTGLLILKVFTREFYKIGITFFVFGIAMLVIALWRRRTSFDVFDPTIPFKTSGNWVLLTTVVTMFAYIVLLVLLWNLS
ncbi:hypothetical protein G6F70_002267 [Rhizopus microsporus]|uniref:DUF202 domain-containing protein n=2 Tax=Rhizopus TaxID=4842 RepID=A0A367JLA0_RHIAZ|nr:hypothetical protein G6F71_005392 [Rhizopus microsporus]RCH90696.1 hypothetical protein CU097_002910 [Rhizopus azygosporus]KAG1202426.1 hypothetical protein G6F70_002267 [Rhizopus microsporus]KAG1206725.1 hypothetical protein G6F69_008621 [Rhizopus microsporus]KAG1235405.1 hypothetical protein G6F67_002785 [Rhizopus microsporus]